MTDQPQPMPTFASNRDRLVYLVAEYKIPLSVMFLATLVILAVWTPKVPKPPASAVHFSISAFLLAIPTYMAGMRIARYLYPGPNWVYVGIADPGTAGTQTEKTGLYDGKKVKPDVWEDRSEVEMSPLEPPEGKFDYVVTRFEWYEEIGEIEVRGADQTTLEPAEAWVNASRVDTIFDHHQSLKRRYAHLKRNVSEKITDVHDATIMTEIAEHEQSDLVPGVEIIEEIEDMESDVKDLPDAPAQDDRTPRERALDLQVADSVDDAMDDLRPEGGRAAATDGGQPDE
ncbi:hypothetical protein [Natrinema ejinorense]|nr:hypothetical protein [Natrinema ejinorense]